MLERFALPRFWTLLRRQATTVTKALLYHSGLSLREVRKRRCNFIVMLHAVRPQEAERFEAFIRFLVVNFQVVPLQDIVDTLQEDDAAHGDRVAITFDDGFSNLAVVAYPILKRYCVPATVYVCPSLIERGIPIWTWELHARLERLAPAEQLHFFRLAGVSGELQAIVDWMKTIPVAHREEIESDIRSRTPGFQFTPVERECYELLTWRQIQQLDASLITVGSHTATHVDLPQTDSARLEEELGTSKRMLESRLNREITQLAYPNGNYNSLVLSAARQHYRSAVTTRPGLVMRGDDSLVLNRIPADYDLAAFCFEIARHARRCRSM